MYDENFDTICVEDRYIHRKQVRLGCKVGFTGFFKIILREKIQYKRKRCMGTDVRGVL